MMDTNELQKLVNPVYSTAQGTLLMLAGAGDKDAIALLPHVGIDMNRQVTGTVPPEINKCFMIGQQARFEMLNNVTLENDAPNVVDLPCGYAPRGFRTAASGKRYFGFDLPSVIHTMKPAAEKAMTPEQRALATYAAVDATNYDSMKKALGDVKGELCIIMEGMLGYFSESELVSLCQGIHRLLSEYGGCWITADVTLLQIYPLTFKTVFRDNEATLTEFMKSTARNMADVEFYKNSLFLNGKEGAKEFLKSQGFSVASESVKRFIPDLPNVDKTLMEALREAYGVMEVMTMRVEKAAKPVADKSLPFAVESTFGNGTFNVKIQGRMDTITAPELLKRFQELPDKATDIEIDVADMAYVSSAGLRVLLMMYKSLEDKTRFKLLNVNNDVKEILEVTGFDQFLL